MAKVTDPLELDEIRLMEALVEMEVRRIKSLSEDDKILYNRLLDLGMIKGKLQTMKRELNSEEW